MKHLLFFSLVLLNAINMLGMNKQQTELPLSPYEAIQQDNIYKPEKGGYYSLIKQRKLLEWDSKSGSILISAIKEENRDKVNITQCYSGILALRNNKPFIEVYKEALTDLDKDKQFLVPIDIDNKQLENIILHFDVPINIRCLAFQKIDAHTNNAYYITSSEKAIEKNLKQIAECLKEIEALYSSML